MTLSAYKKFCDMYLQRNPEAKIINARVLLSGGVWLHGGIYIDDDQVVVIDPPSNIAFPEMIAVDLSSIVALQII